MKVSVKRTGGFAGIAKNSSKDLEPQNPTLTAAETALNNIEPEQSNLPDQFNWEITIDTKSWVCSDNFAQSQQSIKNLIELILNK